MKILPLLVSLVKSLQLFLQLKNELYFSDLRKQSKQRQENLKNEIEKLRNVGDSDSSDKADILRRELASEREQFKHLSTIYSKIKRECPNSDD